MFSSTDIVRRRLHNQYISRPTFDKPGDVVRWFGAVQAQEYEYSLWAIGLRMANATEAVVEQAVADREIVRTWPMRGTLNFVAPEDIRWMLKLMTPRIMATHAKRLLRDWNIDDAAVWRTQDLLESAMQGGGVLTRKEIYEVMEAGGVSTANSRGLHIMGQLAQLGVVCIGPKRGKQHTFALLDEWVPTSRELEREEALAEIARRYFTSHGPATVQDLMWWTGLTAADTKKAVEMVKSEFDEVVLDGKTYYMPPSDTITEEAPTTVHLLPYFDEYTVAYTDRSAIIDPIYNSVTDYGLASGVIIDGKIAGRWKREFGKNGVIVRTQPLSEFTSEEEAAIAKAVEKYSAFIGEEVTLNPN